MNILEYTLGLPPYRRGGLTKYSVDLTRELSQNEVDNVYLMYPGQMNILGDNKVKCRFRKNSENFKVIEMCNPLPVSLGLGISDETFFMQQKDISELEKLLKKLKIDVIHLHTIMGLPLEFFEAVKKNNIKLILTTHDFYGLCPKILSPDSEKLLESSTCSEDCMLCKVGPSRVKLYAMQSHLYENLKETKFFKKIRNREKNGLVQEKSQQTETFFNKEQVKNRYNLREYYLKIFQLIDEFHFNSNVSKDYVCEFLPDAKGKVISITHQGVHELKTKKKSQQERKQLHLGYIGPYDTKKGFFLLQDALLELRKMNYDFVIDFYGDVSTNAFFDHNWVNNHGIVPEAEMEKAYDKMDLLVVPSLWHETFGFVVLEAISHGVPCVVSDTVGAKDLLNKKFVFPSGNVVALKEKLAEVLSKLMHSNTSDLNFIAAEIPVDFSSHVRQIKQEFYQI